MTYDPGSQHATDAASYRNQPVPPGTYGARALLTTLFRRIQPLIRYELSESICRAVQEICACGRPFSRLKGLQGRSADLLSFSTPSGEQVMVNPHVLSQAVLLYEHYEHRTSSCSSPARFSSGEEDL